MPIKIVAYPITQAGPTGTPAGTEGDNNIEAIQRLERPYGQRRPHSNPADRVQTVSLPDGFSVGFSGWSRD